MARQARGHLCVCAVHMTVRSWRATRGNGYAPGPVAQRPRKPIARRKPRRFLGKGLVTNADSAHHTAVRAVVMPAFKQEAVLSYAHTFAEVREAGMDWCSQQPSSQAQPLLARCPPRGACPCA